MLLGPQTNSVQSISEYQITDYQNTKLETGEEVLAIISFLLALPPS